MWRSHQPRFHPDLNRGLYREGVGGGGPISSYQILPCLDVNLDNRVDRGKVFGCQIFFPTNTIASTIGTNATDRMTS